MSWWQGRAAERSRRWSCHRTTSRLGSMKNCRASIRHDRLAKSPSSIAVRHRSMKVSRAHLRCRRHIVVARTPTHSCHTHLEVSVQLVCPSSNFLHTNHNPNPLSTYHNPNTADTDHRRTNLTEGPGTVGSQNSMIDCCTRKSRPDQHSVRSHIHRCTSHSLVNEHSYRTMCMR